MCGRFVQHTPVAELLHYLAIEQIDCDIQRNFNIAPGQLIPAIVYQDGVRLRLFHWGLVPFWAKDKTIAKRLINARVETAAEKPSFRNAFKTRRCLIPADGFYEWQKQANFKQPWYICHVSGEPLFLAGLWETWKSSDNQEFYSCTILTTAASESISAIHSRMPVILNSEAHHAWLDPTYHDIPGLKTLIDNHHIREFQSFPVARRINSPRNNDPNCIQPLKSSNAHHSKNV